MDLCVSFTDQIKLILIPSDARCVTVVRIRVDFDWQEKWQQQKKCACRTAQAKAIDGTAI
jgi:hypothetical protein